MKTKILADFQICISAPLNIGTTDENFLKPGEKKIPSSIY